MRILFGSNPRAAIARSLTIIAVAAIVIRFVLLPVRFQGISMLPTYEDGELNFANRLAYYFKNPKRGDVVAIRMAGESVVYVKRIIGLPHEEVRFVHGTVMINGQPLAEPTVRYRIPWDMRATTLGSDEYFLVGDNRSMDILDHDFGRALREKIVGKMLY
jgi:signal peptidase I